MIIDSSDVQYNAKIVKAATNLVIRLPFFGYLVFGTAVKVREHSCATMGTNGVDVFCGAHFVKTMSMDIVAFGLLHEMLHVYHDHVGRRGNRDPKLWNRACDIYTNGECSNLLCEGGKPWPIPKMFVQPESWAIGLTVEQIYDALVKMEQATPGSSAPKTTDGEPGLGDATDMEDMPEPSGDAPPGDPQSNKTFQESFRQDISSAKVLSENSPLHTTLPEAIRNRMSKILKAQLPWGALLRGTLADDIGWNEQTYAPPKTKYYPIILPRTIALKERILLLGVDISASVTEELIRIFISNVKAAARRATETIVVTFDAVVRETHRTKQPQHIFDHVRFVSGAHSHTSAIGVFEIATKVKPSAICILTDGYIKLPAVPYRRTTFVVPIGGQVPPWGKTYIMEHPWR